MSLPSMANMKIPMLAAEIEKIANPLDAVEAAKLAA
jgi:hypothetical protein